MNLRQNLPHRLRAERMEEVTDRALRIVERVSVGGMHVNRCTQSARPFRVRSRPVVEVLREIDADDSRDGMSCCAAQHAPLSTADVHEDVASLALEASQRP